MLRNMLLVIAAGLLLLAGVGYGYQSYYLNEDSLAYPAPGHFVTVDGSQIHFVCQGQGTPWIMMESGLTSDSTDWELIWSELSEYTRVCAYDRPGLGWSENVEENRSATEVASVLHELVLAENNPDPYVLLGMSAGGVYVRNYYQRYPENVVGMILIDSSHEQQTNRLPKPLEGTDLTALLAVCDVVAPLGVMRAFKIWPQLFASVIDTEKLGLHMNKKIALANQNHSCSALLREMESFAGDIVQTSPLGSLADLPLLVFSQGKPPAEGQEKPYFEAERKVWNELQQELVQLSSNSRRVIADQSGHVIQFDQPDILIREIPEFIQSLKVDALL